MRGMNQTRSVGPERGGITFRPFFVLNASPRSAENRESRMRMTVRSWAVRRRTGAYVSVARPLLFGEERYKGPHPQPRSCMEAEVHCLWLRF